MIIGCCGSYGRCKRCWPVALYALATFNRGLVINAGVPCKLPPITILNPGTLRYLPHQDREWLGFGVASAAVEFVLAVIALRDAKEYTVDEAMVDPATDQPRRQDPSLSSS